MDVRPRDDDSQAVMTSMGRSSSDHVREGIDHGFFNYAKSRKLDPVGHASIRIARKPNMLYDRSWRSKRDLVDAAGKDTLHGKSATTSGRRKLCSILICLSN